LADVQPDERLKSVLKPSFFLLVGEPCQPAKMSPIATPAISAKPRGELARNERAQKPIGKDFPVIQPNLEIVGAKSRPRPRVRNPSYPHFFEGIRAEVVYQAKRMRSLRPDEDMSAASVLPPQPSDALADLIDTPVGVQKHLVVLAQHSDFKGPAPHPVELVAYDRFRD
jgi:hypothetical protein